METEATLSASKEPCCGENPPEDAGRRDFLTRATVALGAVIAAALSATGIGYFISPAFQKREEDWVDLGRAGDFKAGSPALVEFTQRRRDAWVTSERRSSAWVATADGKSFTAFDPRCTHLGCPYRWDAGSERFVCPCHTAVFGPDGHVISGPAPRPLDQYQTKVAGNRLMILPKAEKKA
ncbi:MAG: ubiquinol-cytochrome c reductase iron-sulfur subunit [Elusimicrobia bacterium]|nr:ubiquinol-cytochrome c reductase iron-sulfur subunit [Elusimicrobiota bacterium]